MKAVVLPFEPRVSQPPHQPLLGEIVDARTGEPVSGARVAATGARELMGRTAGATQASFVAARPDGRFEIHLSRRGTLVLAVHAPGYLPAIVPVSVRAERVRVALTRGGSISGTAAGRDGSPMPGARVRGYCQSPLDAAEAVADANGRFLLAGLRPGHWTVFVDGGEGFEADVAEAQAVELRPRG